MKSIRTTHLFSILFTLLFVTGTVISIVYSTNLPAKLNTIASEINYMAINQDITSCVAKVQSTVNETNRAILAMQIILALLAIVYFVLILEQKRVLIKSSSEGLVNAQKEKEELNEDIKIKADQISEMEQRLKLFDEVDHMNKVIQQYDNIVDFANNVSSIVANNLEACQVIFFIAEENEEGKYLDLKGSYAHNLSDSENISFKFGEGLAGQVAVEKQLKTFNNVPESYIQVQSGLGETTPQNLIIVPLLFENNVLGIIEVASFKAFDDNQMALAEKLQNNIGIAINTLQQKKTIRDFSESKDDKKIESIESEKKADKEETVEQVK